MVVFFFCVILSISGRLSIGRTSGHYNTGYERPLRFDRSTSPLTHQKMSGHPNLRLIRLMTVCGTIRTISNIISVVVSALIEL
jgi:hypothetical protein